MVLVYWRFGAAGQFNVALNPISCIRRIINVQVAVHIAVARTVGGVIDATVFITVVCVTVFCVLITLIHILVVRGGESTIKQRNRILFTIFSVDICEIVLGETGTSHESLRLLQ